MKERRILRKVALFNGSLIEGEQRHVIVIPPGTLGGNAHAIHAIILDESVQVAPTGCTLLHLTTTLNSDTPETILDLAVEEILNASIKSGMAPVEEIVSATYSHEISTVLKYNTGENTLPKGVFACSHSGQVLTADTAFEQAEKIFHEICPGHEFLGLSMDLAAAIKERVTSRGHEDEERLMLESALGMISK